MRTWLRRRESGSDPFRTVLRREAPASTRVNFTDLTPDPLVYLGQVAYLTLEQYERLSECVLTAPALDLKEGLSQAAAAAVAKHRAITAEIRRREEDPALLMTPFSVAVDAFNRATEATSWHERLLTVHLTSGILDEFFIRLAVGLPGDVGPRVATALGGDGGRDVIVGILRAGIEEDRGLESRLALWGRRLVGDTLLLARAALLGAGGAVAATEERIEPVFTDLISSHTRRMDELGLTA